MLKESNVEYQMRSTEIPWLSWMGGIALGALAMYIADPVQGRRRRALIQDKLTHVTHSTSRMMDQTLHDAHNRWSGLQASAIRMISPLQAKPIDDHVLEARVRSRLGRAMSHMREVGVHAHQGAVTLSGNLDSEEQEKVFRLVAAIPGVESVVGPAQRPNQKIASFRARSPLWIAGAAGAGILTWYVLKRRLPLGLLAAATGMGLMSRSDGGARRSAVKPGAHGAHGYEAECTIAIAASTDVVFDIWSRYENFPHFMSQVTEVRDLGQNRSH
ncbi:MAG: BON domain-containing protein [Betaproteobacteria bacterium]|nr:BON domain-containing protein [Betaproteobacteria bacterium]